MENGFYNGTIFHRVINDFMIQGGGFTEDMQQKSTEAAIKNEANNGLPNTVGSIAMARTQDPHSATAQFFINVADNHFLNHTGESLQGWGYAVFGEVVSGMEVINQIKSVQTGNRAGHQDVPVEPITMLEVGCKKCCKYSFLTYICPQRPDLLGALIEFLQHPDLDNCTELYILGDLFEYWVGDDHIEPWLAPLIQQLNSFSQTRRCYFLAGNRDFAVGKHFLARCGLHLIKDNHILHNAQQRLLLQHGDLLCWQDKQYLRLRRLLRNPITLNILRRLPLRFRLSLATSLRNKSKSSMQYKAAKSMDACQAAVDYYCKISMQPLLHGHTHKHQQHPRINQSRRTTLGDWGTSLSFAYCQDNLDVHLKQIPINQLTQQPLIS